MTQDEALRILKTGANVFLTGEPGSGKTHTVNRYVSFLRSCGVSPAITASTGIAATHVGGMTIHSWSGIGVRPSLSRYDLDAIASNKRVATRLGNARVLLIDEVSMLAAGTLGMVEAVCREVRRNSEPFGGLQVVFVGDFFQLPPITKRQNFSGPPGETQKEMFGAPPATAAAGFAFSSPVWQKARPIICYLSEQHRQEDKIFLEFLSALRRGEAGEPHRALLKSRFARAASKSGITELYSHNADVDRINALELGKLPGKPALFQMESRGPERLVESLKRGCLSPERLELKIGARVMFTKNDTMTQRFVNGTLGVVSGFSKESGFPLVKTFAGRTIEALPMEWRVEDGTRVIAKVIQIPLRLAWAMTVHKSQGLSLDAAHMDLSSCFEYGQGYVALSRVRTLAGLTLSGLNERALAVHPEIKAKDGEFRAASEAARQKFCSLSEEEILKMHRNFIRAVGGKLPAEQIERKTHLQVSRDINYPSGFNSRKTNRWARTVFLIGEGKTINEVASVRNRTVGTILEHLEALKKIGELEFQKIEHIKPSNERFEKMKKTFEAIREKTGEMKLTPVHELLGESFSFEELRIARLFL